MGGISYHSVSTLEKDFHRCCVTFALSSAKSTLKTEQLSPCPPPYRAPHLVPPPCYLVVFWLLSLTVVAESAERRADEEECERTALDSQVEELRAALRRSRDAIEAIRLCDAEVKASPGLTAATALESEWPVAPTTVIADSSRLRQLPDDVRLFGDGAGIVGESDAFPGGLRPSTGWIDGGVGGDGGWWGDGGCWGQAGGGGWTAQDAPGNRGGSLAVRWGGRDRGRDRRGCWVSAGGVCRVPATAGYWSDGDVARDARCERRRRSGGGRARSSGGRRLRKDNRGAMAGATADGRGRARVDDSHGFRNWQSRHRGRAFAEGGRDAVLEGEESEGNGGSTSSDMTRSLGRPHRVERPAAADATGAQKKSAASELIADARAETAERLLVEERERMARELEAERAKYREREAAREEETRREREVRLTMANVNNGCLRGARLPHVFLDRV